LVAVCGSYNYLYLLLAVISYVFHVQMLCQGKEILHILISIGSARIRELVTWT